MAKRSFEESLARLTEIVGKLEAGDLSLEESLELFEEGVRASKECTQILEEAKRRVQKLAREDEGFRLEMLDEDNPKET